MTAPVDNRDMRLPSLQRTHVTREVALRSALAAVVGLLAVVPASEARARDRGLFVSKGVGRQIFIGGGGVAYGQIFSGGSIVILDYSPTHDMRIDTPVVATSNSDGSKTYVPAGGTARTAFRISGTLYRVTVQGAATLNAINIYGRLQLRGKGTLTVNGGRDRWNGPAVKLGTVPKLVRLIYRDAVAGLPPSTPPVPVPPVTLPATTGTTPSSG
jgi:hypothetical protein